ncbi:hypothetical protein SAY87_009600 [Trapa incisa]|uniref:VQ domain-containing protein n=1 Tax=Trapa incisa TaxID=236973 RepID=A0AAN7K1Z3_9MYRT|nr:hypothetical protein SAY87_009600 [Trapa incisa]
MASQAQTSSTTFIQADTATFRRLVQQLTGVAGDPSEASAVRLHPRLSPKVSNLRSSPAFKLQDRRKHASQSKQLEIKLGLSALDHPLRRHPVGSPGLSPVTPLGPDSAFLWGANYMESPIVSEEEKAIAEKGFYLHASPTTTPRGSEPPELLPLFPVTSPQQDKLPTRSE